MVVKTSVYLDESEKRRLSALSAASGTSEAELIRQGVRRVLDEADRPRPRLGLATSSDGRRARDADDLLQETGFGS